MVPHRGRQVSLALWTGHIGRSPKVPGQAIGHKGIGFKSVLETTAAPEIYSGFAGGDPELAVRFDRLEAILEAPQVSYGGLPSRGVCGSARGRGRGGVGAEARMASLQRQGTAYLGCV